jgi:hypothetical protein
MESPALFVKQFGFMRTGTNYVRALVVDHLPEVAMLVHAWGSKHSPGFSDIDRLQARGPYRLYPWPEAFDARQLTVAQATQQLRVLVSIKDPYATVLSNIIWFLRTPPQQDLRNVSGVRGLCAQYNTLYRGWQELILQYDGVFVQHEDLLTDPAAWVMWLAGRWGLKPPKAFCDIVNTIGAGGDGPYRTESFPYCRQRFFLDRQYLEELAKMGPELLDTITESIDWALLRWYGYAPGGWR